MSHWIEEALAYVGFGPDDEARLCGFADRARPQLPEIARRFYESIAADPGASRVIASPEQLAGLHRTFAEWLETGLANPHDLAWYRTRMRIGRRHVEVGLAAPYMFTAMNVIRRDLHALARTSGEPVELHDSLDRWLDLELAIMTQGYLEDSERRIVETQGERLAAMQRLSAGLAHEVRNPLNAARLQLQLLARRMKRAEVDPSLLEVAALIDGETRRLSELLQEFLDFARPLQLAVADEDLVALARKVVELSAATAASRAITISVSGDDAVVIACDAGKLHQVLGNLVTNALDAAKSKVEVLVRHEGEGAVIVVRDDGAGIPEAVLPHIYEPFMSTKPTGTGMGLAITHSLVSLHGGTVVARNRGGAELTVTLPRTPPPLAAVA